MAEITAKQFEEAVGRPPEDDDLERANCKQAGEIGHWCCGWDHERNLPEFIALAYRASENRNNTEFLAWRRKVSQHEE